MKATAANVRKIPGWFYGWASFKHGLMDELGIPQSAFDTWDVPQEWKIAFLEAAGRA